MKQNIVEDIQQRFKNKVLNVLGVERDLYRLLADKDVDKAIEMMQNRDEEVDNALDEYHPQRHKVMHRPNKFRDHDEPYITEKLPRNLQSYINEIELFFLLGQPIVWKGEGDDEAFGLFKQFLKDTRFDSMIRRVKRIAGSETEAVLAYRIFRNEEDKSGVEVIPFVAARSTGYKIRPLFDQYGRLQCVAYGYTLRETSSVSIRHWDILTKDFFFFCKRGKFGWQVESYPNSLGKIPALYFQQPKSWAGAEPRLDRIEELDSKVADANNYFADPIAEATADVIQSMSTPDKPGRLIQLTGEKSKFGYVTPPNGSEPRREEKAELKATVLFDTMTPDFDVEKMRGVGTLTGAAIKNSFALGYIKRDNRKESWDEMIARFVSVVKAILKLKYPTMEKKIDELEITFEFSDPFASDKEARWAQIQSLYASGVASLETVVQMLGLTDSPEDEVARILFAEQDKVFTANEAKGEVQPSAEQQDAENNGEIINNMENEGGE